WVAIAFFWGAFLIARRTRKYLYNKNLYSTTLRYYWVYKLVRKALFMKRIKIDYTENNVKLVPSTACVFVCNHKSNSDPLAIFVLLYQVMQATGKKHYWIFIAKKELNKKFGIVTHVLSLIDALFLDRDNIRQQIRVLEKENEFIRAKRSIVVFPEGHRYPEEQFGEFKAGALKPAYDCYVPISPVVIFNSSGLFDSNKKFVNKKDRTIYLKVLPALKPVNFHSLNMQYCTEKLQADMQKEYSKMKAAYEKSAK
ncbi:MAG: 1-acyl-sn-glycerol-3-phosphate acyltransferase, partial [Mycoplasmataceae bacterium]|nr:1-acyl-sn-glycerol-3-phosphate acyltransferase [Mycoplasmataceae bacterium]